MNTEAPSGSYTVTRPIQGLGGHLVNAGGSAQHSQDFLVRTRRQISFGAGTTVVHQHIIFDLSQLELMLRAGIQLFQTYRIVNVETILYWVGWEPVTPPGEFTSGNREAALNGGPGDIVVFIAPYSRSIFGSSTANQNIHAQVLPGCQFKYLTHRINPEYVRIEQRVAIRPSGGLIDAPAGFATASNLAALQTQAQCLAITNDNPQYSIGTVGGPQNTLLDQGAVYCNGMLGIQTKYGVDDTDWHIFQATYEIEREPTFLQTANFDHISKITVQFEGTRWDSTVLPTIEPPLGEYNMGSVPLAGKIYTATEPSLSGVRSIECRRLRRKKRGASPSRLHSVEEQPHKELVPPRIKGKVLPEDRSSEGRKKLRRECEEVRELHQGQGPGFQGSGDSSQGDVRKEVGAERRDLPKNSQIHSEWNEISRMLEEVAPDDLPDCSDDGAETSAPITDKVPVHTWAPWDWKIHSRL